MLFSIDVDKQFIFIQDFINMFHLFLQVIIHVIYLSINLYIYVSPFKNIYSCTIYVLYTCVYTMLTNKHSLDLLVIIVAQFMCCTHVYIQC